MSDVPAASDDTWEGERAQRWVEQSAGLELQLAPVGELLFAAARLRPGEAVLDVGCGTGPTTYAAAAMVAPGGRLVGLDVSATMLDAARSADSAGGRTSTPIEWVAADATTWPGAAASFDVVISRFGVMFFADVASAFANLARMTAAEGRLAMVVWPRRSESEIFEVPLAAALRALAGADVAVEEPPPDQGPFSLSDRAGVTTMLHASGWADVEWAPHDLSLAVGGGLAPAAAAEASMAVGPARIIVADIDDAATRLVGEAITQEYEARTDDAGHVVLGARVVVVTANRA
ncbi:MAG: class I SAM-dependent methyltransferase [Actinomycetota bacterium]|nr:class I SAM-dependent methyltransferase [Acidimicrobiia bacterium]MDQ3469619.1 class I SAM-dependent methyltransferase [Actinomycetota bacterium]